MLFERFVVYSKHCAILCYFKALIFGRMSSLLTQLSTQQKHFFLRTYICFIATTVRATYCRFLTAAAFSFSIRLLRHVFPAPQNVHHISFCYALWDKAADRHRLQQGFRPGNWWFLSSRLSFLTRLNRQACVSPYGNKRQPLPGAHRRLLHPMICSDKNEL